MIRSAIFATAVVAATASNATEAPPAMMGFIDSDVMPWVSDPQIVAAINAQNADTAGLSEEEIIARDNVWRAEVGTANTPTIDGVLGHAVSSFLKGHVAASGGRITEAFVMDSRGLNVASSAVTSDYWQGDEAKYANSYGAGAGAVFVDDVELDESTQTYQGQVSIAISDPATGQVIGAITIGLDAGAFF